MDIALLKLQRRNISWHPTYKLLQLVLASVALEHLVSNKRPMINGATTKTSHKYFDPLLFCLPSTILHNMGHTGDDYAKKYGSSSRG